MTTTYTELKLDMQDSVATITFDRPQARNSLGGAMREEFGDVVRDISTNCLLYTSDAADE